jgi:hypothetical protein
MMPGNKKHPSGTNDNTKECQAKHQRPLVVYVLVHTWDREYILPVPQHECEAESEVNGVFSSYKLARNAQRIATKDMEEGSREDEYDEGARLRDVSDASGIWSSEGEDFDT